jgi:hypothetical protein
MKTWYVYMPLTQHVENLHKAMGRGSQYIGTNSGHPYPVSADILFQRAVLKVNWSHKGLLNPRNGLAFFALVLLNHLFHNFMS